jgi:hypothetical protein
MAGGRPASYIARWNGLEWQPLGYGLDSPGAFLQAYNDKLIVSGWFSSVDGVVAHGLAAWDGTTWSSLASAEGYEVPALGVFDNELITTIYEAAPPYTRRFLAAWNGSSWRRFNGYAFNPAPATFSVYNGELVVAGSFTLEWGAGWTHNIARWNGETWLPFGSGLDLQGLALLVHEGHLYVGGAFTTAGGKVSEYIARWDDIITAVLLEDFAAIWDGAGVRLAWRFSSDVEREAAGAFVQRAETERGPWADQTPAALEPRVSMSYFDDTVAPGRQYWYRLRLSRLDGEEEILRPIGIATPLGTRTARLEAPVVPADGRPIEIRFEITGQAMPIQLDVFDARGRLVRALDHSLRAPGIHVVTWNRDSVPGVRVPRGVYLARLRAAGIEPPARKLVIATRR